MPHSAVRGGTLAATAVLATGFASLAQTLAIVLVGLQLTMGAILMQTCFLLLLHLVLALGLGWWFRRRALEAAYVTIPLMLAADPLLTGALGGGAVSLLVPLGAALVLALLWAVLRRTREGAAPATAALMGWTVAAAARIVLSSGDAVNRPAGGGVTTGGLVLVLGLVLLALVPLVLQRRVEPLRRLLGGDRPALGALVGLALLGGAFGVNGLARGAQPAMAVREGSTAARPPVVVIVLDGMRADHLKMYGYQRDTMPGLESFARAHGVVAERGISTASNALSAHASLFTGLNPIRHGAHQPLLTDKNPPAFGYRLKGSIPTMAGLLASAGYWTVGVVANTEPLSPIYGLDRGFDSYANAPKSTVRAGQLHLLLGHSLINLLLIQPNTLAIPRSWISRTDYRQADAITDQAINAVQLARDRSFFLFVNYMDLQPPYGPPEPFLRRFPGFDPHQRAVDFGRDVYREVRGLQQRELTPAERAHGTALYDGSAAFVDRELHRLLQALRKHPRWDEMLVIVTSDHGRALGEHRNIGHASSVYREEVWVPLVIKAGKQDRNAPAPGTRISHLMQLTDLFPTVLEHAGVTPPGASDGVAWGKGRTHAFSWSFVNAALAPIFPRFRREQSGIQDERYKVVLEKPSGRVEVYDLRNDPRELHDLAAAMPPDAAALKDRLVELERLAHTLKRVKGNESAKTLRKLKSLGYIQ